MKEFNGAYYCIKRRLSLWGRIINRVQFWKPKIDYVITDMELNHITTNEKTNTSSNPD